MTDQQEDPGLYDFDELDDSFAFDTEALDAFETEEESDIDTRLIKPPKSKDKTAAWKNAKKTASKIEITPGMSYFGIIDGSFIFGDLIEALLVGKRIRARRLDIQTLSLSQENVDSLATLLIKGYVKELNLIISDYFFAHERKVLIPYIYEHLDIADRFQLAVCGLHTKIITMELTEGIKLVIHGSANLRSSGNIEQIAIQDSAEIYDFIIEMNDKIIKKFNTINKSIRRKRLWLVLEAPKEMVAK
jgi:hypothetical protein